MVSKNLWYYPILSNLHVRQRINSVNSDRETDNIISHNVGSNNEFRQQENILKLAILRAQLNKEEKESKIRMEQEKVKLNILKLQLKRKKSASKYVKFFLIRNVYL